ncbi:MAG: 2Fe-2S iron-sulfur cluster-binding protein [Pseudomonadota bacterium]
MSDTIAFLLDGKEVLAAKGRTILEAAEAAGTYIPRLCFMKGLLPFGSCRVCTVLVNGRPQAACTQPVAPGIVVESDTEEIKNIRKKIIELLFVEGNHFCMSCEKSGNCELQALAYRFGICAPTLPYQLPQRELDASHPDVFLDRNRCILCGRCVRSSQELDGKHVFQFVGRGSKKKIAVNAKAKLADTELSATDKAAAACPVGAILRKRTGFMVPIGKRLFDVNPIGTDIESARATK